jgi:hypothetical protein
LDFLVEATLTLPEYFWDPVVSRLIFNEETMTRRLPG